MDERHPAPRTDRLVLRVEISAEDGPALAADALAAGLQQLVVPVAPPPEPVAASERLELEQREAGLRAREAELDERLAAAEREHAARVAELERRAAEQEADRESRDGLTASEKIRLAQRARRAAELEEELGERMRDVDEREERLDTREAEFEADVELREQRMERWRAELTELEQRLERKESELLLYVGEVQGELSRREVGWWPTGPAPGTVRHH
jgi:DNA repair exonuclease SbcCD ATPase subunit